MNPIKNLLGQTAIYGLPSIVGRLLNYMLVPIYTSLLPVYEYGKISELYALVAFLIVLLTFGMETAFFKFINSKEKKKEVFQSSFLTVIVFNLIFLLLIFLFNQHIANILLYNDHAIYIILLASIVAIDATSAMPMAKLRADNKAVRFATIHFSSIILNITLNLVFLYGFFNKENPEQGILFILVANLLASFIKPIATYKDYFGLKLHYNRELAREMFKYSLPLVIAGFAGIINETIDRAMLKQVLYNKGGLTLRESETQLGIYSACYKLAMIVTIFLQAYRYAAEPFFFAQEKKKDSKNMYSKIMNYFVAFVCLIFITVSLNIDVFKYFIRNEEFWVGLNVVPILLIANVFYGIYLNQSIWYKLSGQTKYGAFIAIVGGFVTILLNFIFIPIYGFWACAWATMFVYGGQMIASYFLGQKYYPIKYNLRKFLLYFGFSLIIFFVAFIIDIDSGYFSWRKFIFHNSLILVYIFLFCFIERPKLKKTND